MRFWILRPEKKKVIEQIIASFTEGVGRRAKVALVFAAVYSMLIALFVGWRGDHTFFIIFISIALLANKYTYKLALTLSAFILFWIIYDSMRIYPNYKFNDVHVFEPHSLELALFGVWDAGEKVVLSQWFVTRTSSFLTLFAGVSYLMWVPGPMLYALYLVRDHKDKMVDFTYGFLLTNFIGFVIYYAYPAAPPWYFINYGGATDFTIPGNPGLLADFDALVGAQIFGDIYNKNANVFAAIPSLHAAYPVIALFFAIKNRNKKFIAFFSFLTFAIWFAAVYSQHHYIIDLLLGFLCAVGGYYLIQFLRQKKFYQSFRLVLTSEL